MDFTANQDVTPPNSPSNNNETSEATNQTLISRWRNLWQYNRHLAIAFTAGASIIALVILIGLISLVDNLLKSSNQSPQPYKTYNSQVETTHNPEDDAFFAGQPLTMVYYSFAQTTNSKNIIQATPSDRETRVIDIGFPDKYDFASSPDGKWLLRWDKNTIARASAVKPSEFKPVFTSKDGEITSVVWENDASSIAVVTSKPEANDQTGENHYQSVIRIIPLMTLEPVTVLENIANHQYELVALPETTQLYFQLSRDNVPGDLTLYNTQSKKIEQQFNEFNQDNLLSKLIFTKDMKWAYVHTDTEVIQYNLDTKEKKTVFTINRQCFNQKQNLSTINTISISPTGQKLLVNEKRQQCERIPEDADSTARARTRTGIYQTTDFKQKVEKYDLFNSQIELMEWSPAEDKIWLKSQNFETYTMNPESLDITNIPAPERQTVTKERLFFIGWLTP